MVSKTVMVAIFVKYIGHCLGGWSQLDLCDRALDEDSLFSTISQSFAPDWSVKLFLHFRGGARIILYIYTVEDSRADEPYFYCVTRYCEKIPGNNGILI